MPVLFHTKDKAMNDRYTQIRTGALRSGTASSVIDGAAHRVLRNTYMLL